MSSNGSSRYAAEAPQTSCRQADPVSWLISMPCLGMSITPCLGTCPTAAACFESRMETGTLGGVGKRVMPCVPQLIDLLLEITNWPSKDPGLLPCICAGIFQYLFLGGLSPGARLPPRAPSPSVSISTRPEQPSQIECPWSKCGF